MVIIFLVVEIMKVDHNRLGSGTLGDVHQIPFHQATQMKMDMEILNTQYLVDTLRYAQKI